MKGQWELLLQGGGKVLWDGKDGEDAARRYADAHRGSVVIAFRWAERHLRAGRRKGEAMSKRYFDEPAVTATVRFLTSDTNGDPLEPESQTFGANTAQAVNAAIEAQSHDYGDAGITVDDVVLDDWSPRTLWPEALGFTTTRRNLE